MWEGKGEINLAEMGFWGVPAQKENNITTWTWGKHDIMARGAPTCRNCGGSTGEHEREPFTNRNCPLPRVEINGIGQLYPWGRWLGSILRIRVAGAKTKQKKYFNHEGRRVGDTGPEDRHKRKLRIFEGTAWRAHALAISRGVVFLCELYSPRNPSGF